MDGGDEAEAHQKVGLSGRRRRPPDERVLVRLVRAEPSRVVASSTPNFLFGTKQKKIKALAIFIKHDFCAFNSSDENGPAIYGWGEVI